jgi:hypothetical protein
MAEQLEIKHGQPSLRRMAADYRLIFSGVNLKFTLSLCVLILIPLIGWFVTPPLRDTNSKILQIIILLDGYFFVRRWRYAHVAGCFTASCAFHLSARHHTA